MNLRIMTYNIQHGRIYRTEPELIDLRGAGDAIKRLGADIIGLNEVRGPGERGDYTAQTGFLAGYTGFHSFFGRSIYVGGMNPYGNAVLSRFPIVSAEIIRIPDPALPSGNRLEPRTVTRAEIEIPDGGHFRRIAVFTSHFGLNSVEKEHAVSTAASLMRDEKLPFVFMGDFNMTPDDPLLAPLSVYADSNADIIGGKLSFPSINPTKRIDYIYTSPDIRVLGADIPDEHQSDHRPVVMDTEL